jgi:hypothetical protein
MGVQRNHFIHVQHLTAQCDVMTHFQALFFIQAAVTSQRECKGGGVLISGELPMNSHMRHALLRIPKHCYVMDTGKNDYGTMAKRDTTLLCHILFTL